MKLFPKISLTGDLGSGKSHLSRLLSERLGYKIISTGFIQREIAAKYGMTTLELNEYTRTHPEIDEEIDGRVSELENSSESLIFDSRLAWHFAPHSFKVYLTVDPDVAAARIFKDQRASEKYQTVEEAKKQILARRQSELQRFKEYYNIDYADLNNYDVVVNTSHRQPDDVCETIIHSFEMWRNE
jgi:cytidylate kinase